MTTGRASTGSRVSAGVSTAVSRAFRAAARVRHAPAVHPRGIAFRADLDVAVPGGFPLPPGQYDAVGRLSKGAGTPGGRADVLGLALRISSAETSVSDVLLSSCGVGRLTRWLPRPARSWSSARYGTLSPYEVDGSYVWLLATPEGADVSHASTAALMDRFPTDFTLSISVGHGGGWRPIGRMELRRPLAGLDGLAFDPVLNGLPDARLAPRWLSRLRESAYSGSRRGRQAASPVPTRVSGPGRP